MGEFASASWPGESSSGDAPTGLAAATDGDFEAMIKNPAKIKNLLFALLLGACFVASGGVCFAQGPEFGPINDRPAVSPYLNLLDLGYSISGLSPYQTLVQPLIQQRDATNQQQAQIQQLQRAQRATTGYGGARGTAGAGVHPTGHATRFFNYSHYYVLQSRRPTR
jgi:hypothetical protein